MRSAKKPPKPKPRPNISDPTRKKQALLYLLTRRRAAVNEGPEALAQRLKAKKLDTLEIIHQVGILNAKESDVLALAAKLSKLGMKPKDIVDRSNKMLAGRAERHQRMQVRETEKELAALQEKYHGQDASEIPPRAWARILELGRTLRELQQKK